MRFIKDYKFLWLLLGVILTVIYLSINSQFYIPKEYLIAAMYSFYSLSSLGIISDFIDFLRRN